MLNEHTHYVERVAEQARAHVAHEWTEAEAWALQCALAATYIRGRWDSTEELKADGQRAEADVLNALWDFGKRICSPVVCHFATTYGSKP